MRQILVPAEVAQRVPPPGHVVHALSGLTMGTGWNVRLLAPALDPAWETGIVATLEAIVAQMSHWLPTSDLCRFNRAPAGSWHALPAMLHEVLGYGLDVAEQSGGAFDPCAGALVDVWGFGPGAGYADAGFAPPSQVEIDAARARGGWRRLARNASAREAFQAGGVQLDFSAIAKGYAVDCVADYLQGQGIDDYLVEVGGELRGAGMKPDGQPWWVALEDADGAQSERSPLLALHGLAVATSGDYRRMFRRGAVAYSHSIDPRSGQPIQNGVASVSVVHARCMAADAWSTALTVLGHEEGLRVAERLGLAARFLVRQDDDNDGRGSNDGREYGDENDGATASADSDNARGNGNFGSAHGRSNTVVREYASSAFLAMLA